MFKMYGDHFVPGSIPVALTGNSPQPAPQTPVGGDQPETNSGSATYPLDMFAALTPDRKFLTLSVVNATDSEKRFALNLAGAEEEGAPAVWQLTGKDLQATDRVGQTPQVRIEKIAARGDGHTLSVVPISISIFEIPLAAGKP
jgi:alpha-N-arabinofuranosidase